MNRKVCKDKLILKKIRLLFGILVFVILIFRVRMVEAGSNDSVIKKNRVENIYAIANVEGKEHLYYLNMYALNDKVAYCIELGVDITSDIYNSTYDFKVSNLSDSKIQFIKNVSYFGYGYINHNDYRYYMATQEIIWEYLSETDVEWTNVMDVNGTRINIDSYKQEILSLLKDYDKDINFDGYTKEMKVKIGDKKTLIDINNNIKYYEIKECKNCSAMINGNKIYIDFDTGYIGNTIVTLKRKEVYNYDSLLYYQSDSQKLISNGNIDEEVKLSFNVLGKNMNLQLNDTIKFKHNNQFDYSGIKFDLYDSKKNLLKMSIGGDSSGKLVVENMPYGTYYVKQRIYNYAYILNNVFQKVIFDDDEIILVDVVPVINKYKFIKFYGEGDSLFAEEGIVFDIYNIDGTLYESVITDETGIVVFDLPYGEYVIKQKNSSLGYSKVDDFYINGKKNYDDVTSYTLVDELIKTNIVINTKDVDGNLILENNFFYKIKCDDKYLEFNGVNQFGSLNGVVQLPGKLGPGEYMIEVINDSKLYKEQINNIKFKIDDTKNLVLKNGDFYLELDVIYNLVSGKVKVNAYKEFLDIKDNSYYYDYVNNGNIKLEMIADEDIIVNENIIYNKGDKVEEFLTNKNGEYLIDNVYLGRYCLIGTNGNNCFEVNSSEELKVNIIEKLNKGSIIIHNVSDNSKDIMGTIIELYNLDNKLMYVGSTNECGIIKIEELAYGDYCFKERSVEDNYLINKDKICFSINGSNDLLELEIVNEEHDGNKLINLPNTYSDGKSIKKLLVLLFMILGGIMYKVKKINSGN